MDGLRGRRGLALRWAAIRGRRLRAGRLVRRLRGLLGVILRLLRLDLGVLVIGRLVTLEGIGISHERYLGQKRLWLYGVLTIWTSA